MPDVADVAWDYRTGAGFGPDRAGAASTLADLFRDHHLELVRMAVVMTGDLGIAEDVVQDAFERLHRGWHGLRRESAGLAHVRSSVLNGCRSGHRRTAVARKHAPRLADSPVQPDGLQAAAERGELAAALRLLPRRQREVLVLRCYLDLDTAEIAATLRITQSAVRATVARGLAALGRQLGED